VENTSLDAAPAEPPGTAAHRPAAFILAGAFRVLCRNHRYVTELVGRGLKVLVLTPESSREQAEAAMRDSASPAALVDAVAYVRGAMDVEGSFNPGVFAALQRWRQQYHVVGAYAMEEMLVEPTSVLCDVLGLPGPGQRAGRACRSKYLQRAYLSAWSPASLTVAPGERSAVPLDGVSYPVVVKPAARHASSGVIACETAAQAAAALRGYPPYETVLVEERVVGQEYSVESLVQDGRILFASVTRKETTETDSTMFVELAHSVPAAPNPAEGTAVTATLLESNAGVLAALDFRNGITHSEWRVTDTGRPFLMEIASRTPGDGLTPLYELACGQPLEPQIIAIALGEPATFPAPRRFARQIYLEHRPGRLRDVVIAWPGAAVHWIGPGDMWPLVPPGAPGDPATLRTVLVLKPRGSVLTALSSSDDRAVTLFLDAGSPAELDELERRVRAAVTVVVDPLVTQAAQAAPEPGGEAGYRTRVEVAEVFPC
jgi:hypothetical protein